MEMAISDRYPLLMTLLPLLFDPVHVEGATDFCEELVNITGGQYTCTDGFTDGSRCTYTCDINYQLSGPTAVLRCNYPTGWDNMVPQCTPMVGAIRLQKVAHNMGTLEIYRDTSSTWGSICDIGFTDISASIACKQLRLGNVGFAYTDAYFGPSFTGNVWLSDVSCHGNEPDLLSCPRSDWGAHGCIQAYDVGIECLENYEYRLNGGPTPNSGRVEIMAIGKWAGICDMYYDMAAANVTCNYLGYEGAYSYHVTGEFTNDPPIPVHYVRLNCTGDEASLAECNHDLALTCTPDKVGAGVTCRGGGVRLDGPSNYEGLLLIQHGGQWGLVDMYAITDTTAKVVCNILGFGYIGYKINYYETLIPVPMSLYDLYCVGNETDIAQCPHSEWQNTPPVFNEGSGVVCREFEIEDIRLVDGTSAFEGRVEIKVEGIWGTVCDDDWDLEDAHVICRMLGYSEAEDFYQNAYFGEGEGHILADDVDCHGNETRLEDCDFTKGETSHNCIHAEDASVKCKVNLRCFNQWDHPATTKFVMTKIVNAQSNFTEIETAPTSNDISCVRKCNAHARDNCGLPIECKLVRFDVLSMACTLYYWDRVPETAPCSTATPCYGSVY